MASRSKPPTTDMTLELPDITPWPSQDHINNAQCWPRSAAFIHPISQVFDLFHRLMQEIIEFPYLCQLIEVIMQGLAVLCGVSSVPMIMAVKALIPLGWIPAHLIGPLEKWLVFLSSLVSGTPIL